MATRTTQESRVIVADPTAAAVGGTARVTQESRVMVADVTPFTLGGTARVTQIARVVVCTIQMGGGGLRTMGVGS